MSVKPIQRSEIRGFSKGLATDLNPIQSQVDSTRSEVNFNLDRDGSRSRRLGLDRELFGKDFSTSFEWSDLSLRNITSYYWDGVAGDANRKFIVVQIEDILHFFETNSGTQGETELVGTLTIPYSNQSQIRYANLDGKLGIVNGSANIGLVTYTEGASPLFTFTSFRLKIRDQFGIEEKLNTAYETNNQYRGALTWEHYYNLYNQGWAIPRKDWVYGNPAPSDAVWLGSNKNISGKAPSNSDTVWLGMDRKPTAEDSLENYEAFHYAQFEGSLGSDAVAAKGFFIIDAFDRGASRLSAWNQHKANYANTGTQVTMGAFPTDTTSGGPTSICAHSGRFFYSGCSGKVTGGDARSPNFNNIIFFTQLVKNNSDFGKCYQEGDPTSRESSDIIDTDGGFIFVSDANNIHTMYSFGGRLFLIAENGVWMVSGGSDYGFAATNYKVERISSYGAIPNQSFVEFGGAGFFWGWDAIYSISRNQFGDYEVQPISKDVIDEFYSTISEGGKRTCQGLVDDVRRQIRWVYTEGAEFEDAVSKELILDLKFQAFVPFTLTSHPDSNAYLITGVKVGQVHPTFTSGLVLVGDSVVLSGVDVLRTSYSEEIPTESNIKYITVRGVEDVLVLNFCEYINPSFEDWKFTGYPVDAAGYLETNTYTGDDFSINKQVPYLTMAFKNTPRYYLSSSEELTQQTSCLGIFKWNFSDMARSGKWSREQQLFRPQKRWYGGDDIYTGFDIITTKTKIRGIGKAFTFRVYTEPKKDCHIYGWNFSITANST